MPKIDAKDYIDELLFNIERRDSIKAKVLLRHIDDVEEKARRRLLFELSRCDDEYALPLLASLVSENASVQEGFPVIRQVLLSKFMSRPEAILPYLKSGSPKARALFAGIAAEIRSFEGAEAMLSELSAGACGEELESAFIAALGEMCFSEASNAIAERLASPALSKIAARALGRIGSLTAMQRLSDCVGKDPELDAIALEVFADVQDETSLRKLNEAMLSHSAAIRNSAKSKLVRIGSKAVPMLIENLMREDDTDLLIHTLNVLGSIADKSAVAPVRKLVNSEHRDPNVRFAAYETLGMLPLDKGAYVLASGLADPVDNVCVAAAKAIDRNYNEVLSAGIRNLLQSGGESFRRLLTAVIDAEADKIFMDLVDDETVKKFALSYIKNKAHEHVRDHFKALFEELKRQDLASAIAPEPKPAAAAPKPTRSCVVVDDSRTILSVYRNTLHKLGWSAELFEFPAAALERLKKAPKPDILITDLNMPDMTGIELAAAARALFPASELPILMVTTQHEPQDNDAASKAGVGLVAHKPFTEDSIGKAVETLLSKGKGA